MYQDGKISEEKQSYYIGLVDETPLNYPDMGRKIATPSANTATATQASSVKTAVGVSASNKYDLLALAALFIAEGRRNRLTLATHPLLMDLIEDQVAFGPGGAVQVADGQGEGERAEQAGRAFQRGASVYPDDVFAEADLCQGRTERSDGLRADEAGGCDGGEAGGDGVGAGVD